MDGFPRHLGRRCVACVAAQSNAVGVGEAGRLSAAGAWLVSAATMAADRPVSGAVEAARGPVIIKTAPSWEGPFPLGRFLQVARVMRPRSKGPSEVGALPGGARLRHPVVWPLAGFSGFSSSPPLSWTTSRCPMACAGATAALMPPPPTRRLLAGCLRWPSRSPQSWWLSACSATGQHAVAGRGALTTTSLQGRDVGAPRAGRGVPGWVDQHMNRCGVAGLWSSSNALCGNPATGASLPARTGGCPRS